MTHGLTLASERVEIRCSGPAGVGVCRGFETQQIYQDSQLLVACDCDLDNADDLARAISRENIGTAALLATLYQRFGEAFIEKLSGAFSIILWDSAQHILLAAVDGFGIHRLAYYHDGKSLLVASRIDAITRVGDIEVNINPGAIANVVNFTTILGSDTVFKEIQRLPAGAVLVSRDGGVRVRQYWDMRYIPDGPADEATLCREMDRIVEQAVAVNCANAAPDQVGSFLSGGTDSSTLLGMMSRWAKCPVQAFSIGFQEQPFNEMEYAELAAKTFGARHHTYYVNAQDCFDVLPRMVRYFDEPFGNSSAIATYFCGRLAAQHGVKMLLAGDGGDELFGGNERYRTDKIFHVYGDVPPVLRKQLIEPVLALIPGNGGPIGRVKRYVRRAKMKPMERFCSFQFLATHTIAEVFEDDFLEQLGDHSFLDIPARHYAMAPASHHLDRLLYVDVKITLADSDLPKVTCMSEMSGIRARFPFLHRSVAEFSGRIPAHLKVKGFEKRYLFKRAFRNLLPAEIVRKKKHGFGIPVADWMRSDTRMRELARDTLLSKRASERGYFKQAFIENLFRKHEVDSTSFYGDTLWTFLVLELWHRRVVDELARVSA
ncbi:MAG TPA: asparagine synthase-related protein [Bryobacteraceae bacterium]|nr:asparagine synthase-related protein [Bryobacteraceae bacterium]